MNETSDDHESAAVNAYRIEQLEADLEALRNSGKQLNFEQLKQMMLWLGVPVAIATGVFGISLWTIIEDSSTSAAESRADETVNRLTLAVEDLKVDIEKLQAQSKGLVEGLISTQAKAEYSAELLQDIASDAVERANSARDLLGEIEVSAETVKKVEDALTNVDEIALEVAKVPEFQNAVLVTL